MEWGFGLNECQPIQFKATHRIPVSPATKNEILPKKRYKQVLFPQAGCLHQNALKLDLP